ncbi:MAG: flotillin family protein, partial [Deltaproteobacteria bacterium]|nr:flotillin family protein [Deltaproteobacteria bacterium]
MEIVLAILGALLLVAVVSGLAIIGTAGNLLYICEPNEVLVISGGGTGKANYRTVKGGRHFRIPLLQRVDRIDLTNLVIDLAVTGAYSKGGIPLTVQGVANVKVAGHEPVLGNAVERLLDKSRDDLIRIARDVLEGNLRGVLARLTPEEVNDDKIAFAEMLLDEAETDLSRLGLVLDNMKIQNVADDVGYLNSIGRKQSAEIIKKSRIAEAKAKTAAIIRDASNRERARLMEIDAEEQIARARAARRIADAKTRRHARIAEEEGEVQALIAKAEAAMEKEEARVEETRRRLEADVIEPAGASMEAQISEAKGGAAKILEEGRATVQVLEEMIAVWHEAGDNARDIFLMQKLQNIMDALIETVGQVKVDRLTMLPPDGEGGDTARKAVRLVEELKGALGVDLPKML